MKRLVFSVPLLFVLAASAFRPPVRRGPSYVVIAYVGGFRGLINADSIAVEKLTHINYAFVDIRDGQAWLHNEHNDTINFSRLNAARIRNPGLKILISIGGWSWSKHFSDAVLTDSSRGIFAASAARIVAAYGLDGVDIDWEYPGMRGDDNGFRPEDKENYTLMFKTLRESFDSLTKLTGRLYQITTAVGASDDYIRHTSMDRASRYLDFINVMSYDFKESGGNLSGHHTNLMTARDDPAHRSADRAIRAFEATGVPAAKIVIGIAFYGHGWKMASADNHGLFRPSVAPFRVGGGYTYIRDSLVGQRGYDYHWDRKAKAPWLFQAQEKVFISYDNERSVKAKCKYTKKNGLAGVMFWEYFGDRKEYLLDVIDHTLEH